LQEQLPRDLNQRNAGFMLERYLDNLTSYAETVCDQLFSNGLDEPQGSEHGSIRQQWSAPTSRPRSRAASSRSSRDLGAEIPDLPVFTGNPKDPNSPNFVDWLLEIKAKVTADGMDMDEEAKMTYIRNRVGDLALTHLMPRLHPGCENPFTTGDEMFEVLSQVFANQNSNKPAWATENELTPQSISPKPLKPPSPLIATATSSLATTSRENRDQQLETETERTQHLQPRYASQLQ